VANALLKDVQFFFDVFSIPGPAIVDLKLTGGAVAISAY
jgi:hypothetical protein